MLWNNPVLHGGICIPTQRLHKKRALKLSQCFWTKIKWIVKKCNDTWNNTMPISKGWNTHLIESKNGDRKRPCFDHLNQKSLSAYCFGDAKRCVWFSWSKHSRLWLPLVNVRDTILWKIQFFERLCLIYKFLVFFHAKCIMKVHNQNRSCFFTCFNNWLLK